MEILNELDAAFAADPMIDELGFMFGYEPSAIVLTEHKLGVSTKYLKPLFRYVSGRLRELLGVKAQVGQNWFLLHAEELVRLSRAALVVRADNPLALNLRKQLIESSTFLDAMAELHLLQLLFMVHPKSPSCWEHRRWCLVRAYPVFPLPTEALETELALTARMADCYPRNYYAWTHRLWMLPQLNQCMLQTELEFIRSWLRTHISDYSATSFHVQLLRRVATDTSTLTQLLQEEYALNRTLLMSYPYQENLWLQRRALFSLAVERLPSSLSSRDSLALRCLSDGLRGASDLTAALTDVAGTLRCMEQSADRALLDEEVCLLARLPLDRDPHETHSSHILYCRHIAFLLQKLSVASSRDAEEGLRTLLASGDCKHRPRHHCCD